MAQDAARLPAPDPGAQPVAPEPLRAGRHVSRPARRRPGGLRRSLSRRGSCAGPRQLPLLMGLTPTSACARLNRRTLAELRPLRRAVAHGVLRRRPGHRAAGPMSCAPRRRRGTSHDGVTITGAGHFLQEDRGRRAGRRSAARPDRSDARRLSGRRARPVALRRLLGGPTQVRRLGVPRVRAHRCPAAS